MHSRRFHLVRINLASWLALATASFGRPASEAPVAHTTSGPVSGQRVSGDVVEFRGISYGADTAGTRFRAPRPPAPWTEIRPAISFAANAPQPGGGRRPHLGESEDCLHLNVWTPALRDGKSRPTLVYFHGGAYNGGSVNEELYNGTRLSRHGDIVVVTVNHRLNGFGFLYLAEMGGEKYRDSGNAGMLDLVLALQWVHDNIREFGGDPGNVTIFGQSGGGAKCATLMAMPAAHGLFQKVWTMSGQQLTGRTREHATADARHFLDELHLPVDHLDDLDHLPWEKLSAAMAKGTWVPVVDGANLPRDPFAPEASPLSAKIPMVLGNTHDETRSLIGEAHPEYFSLTWAELPAAISAQVKTFIGSHSPAEIVAEYRKIYPQYSPTDVFFAVATAARSWKGMVLETERRAKQGGPTWAYNVDWPSPADGGKWRAPHTVDIPLAFENTEQSKYTNGSTAGATLAREFSESLVAFARSGNPDTARIPHWPVFDNRARSTMIFDQPVHLEQDPRGAERKFFADAVYIQPGT